MKLTYTLKASAIFILFNYVTFNLLSIDSLAQEISTKNKWSLPLLISDENTRIGFEVDSTWVLVKGSSSGIKGKINYQSDPGHTVISELSLPVSNLKTGLEMRDSHLYEIMAMDKFPEIRVNLSASDSDCNPEVLLKAEQCNLVQRGQITIRGITREITLDSVIKKSALGYQANGSITFPWAAFEIEDPSNLFAKLQPDVTVSFSVDIQK